MTASNTAGAPPGHTVQEELQQVRQRLNAQLGELKKEIRRIQQQSQHEMEQAVQNSFGKLMNDNMEQLQRPDALAEQTAEQAVIDAEQQAMEAARTSVEQAMQSASSSLAAAEQLLSHLPGSGQ